MAHPFLTDSSISKGGKVLKEKELVPWVCTENNAEDYELDSTTSKGWDVDEMFKQNEEIYGVVSNFDQELSTYTTPLLTSNVEDFKDAEAKASKIASEIESNPISQVRLNIEDCEEDKYAAVIRPNSEHRTINTSQNNSNAVLTNHAKAIKTKPFLKPTLAVNSNENTCDGSPLENLVVPTSSTYISGTNIHTNKKAFSRKKYCKSFNKKYLPTSQEAFEPEGNKHIVLNSGNNCDDKRNSLSLQDSNNFQEKSEPYFYDMPTDLKLAGPQTSLTTSGVTKNAPGIRNKVNDKFQSSFSLPNNSNEKTPAPAKMAPVISTNSAVSNCNTEIYVAPSVVRSQPNSSNALKSSLNPDAAPFVPRKESHKPALLTTPPPPLMNCIPEYLPINQPVIKIIPPLLSTPSFPSSVPQQPQQPFFYLGSPNYFPHQLPLPCCNPAQNSAQPFNAVGSGPPSNKTSDMLQKSSGDLVSPSMQTEPKKMDHRHYSQRWL